MTLRLQFFTQYLNQERRTRIEMDTRGFFFVKPTNNTIQIFCPVLEKERIYLTNNYKQKNTTVM